MCSRVVERKFQTEILHELQNEERAHLRSQGGPGAEYTFLAIPCLFLFGKGIDKSGNVMENIN